MGAHDELVTGHINPEGLHTVSLNINLTKMDLSQDEIFRGQSSNYVTWMIQLALCAPDMLDEETKEITKVLLTSQGLIAEAKDIRGFNS